MAQENIVWDTAKPQESVSWDEQPKPSSYDRFLDSLRNPQTGGKSGVVGPMILGGTGEIIKGLGALGQMITPNTPPTLSQLVTGEKNKTFADRMVEVGGAMTQGAKSVAPVAGTVGQVGSYVLPFTAAQKGVTAVSNIPKVAQTVSKLPSYLRAMGAPITQTAIGGGTGYALTPDQENREEAAAFGAIGGAGGELIKPIVKAGGNLASEVIGNLSGVGSQAYKTAYKSAVEGGEKLKALADNLRKKAPMDQVVDDALTGLSNMGKNLQNQYRSGMIDIKKDKTILDFKGIDDSLNNARNFGVFKGKVTNQELVDKVDDVKKIVDNWKKENPADFHTPEGMDQLKQLIGVELEKIPFEQKTLRKAVGGVYSSVRDEVKKQAPVYDSVMKNYSQGLDYASDLKRTLSLGEKSTSDQALRKLQSVMRNDVNTNYGNRVNYAEILEDASGKPIMSQLAGQSLSSLTPRGLQKLLPSATGGSALAFSNPYLLAALPFQSPRLMGEATILAGKASRPVVNLANSGTPEQRQLAKLLTVKAAQQGASNE
jgi:hypothetical protein